MSDGFRSGGPKLSTHAWSGPVLPNAKYKAFVSLNSVNKLRGTQRTVAIECHSGESLEEGEGLPQSH